MKTCKKCACAENPDDAIYCRNCGDRIIINSLLENLWEKKTLIGVIIVIISICLGVLIVNEVKDSSNFEMPTLVAIALYICLSGGIYCGIVLIIEHIEKFLRVLSLVLTVYFALLTIDGVIVLCSDLGSKVFVREHDGEIDSYSISRQGFTNEINLLAMYDGRLLWTGYSEETKAKAVESLRRKVVYTMIITVLGIFFSSLLILLSNRIIKRKMPYILLMTVILLFAMLFAYLVAEMKIYRTF